jgi:uncharacterized repeat protein (TIGR03803 family)
MKCNKSCLLLHLTLVLMTLCSTLAFASEQIIFAFPADGLGGSVPTGGLISDAAGNLYGTTASGGAFGYGSVFKLSFENGTWTEDLLYSFKGWPHDGSGPESALLLEAGSLYGTTAAGGPSGFGTVFRLAPDRSGGWTETILHAFNGKDGSLPVLAPLVSDAHGNLYGVTQGYCYRGTCGNGTVFELSPQQNASWSFKVLHSFGYSGQPDAGVIFDKAGNLYGTTTYGGPLNCFGSGCGTVFKLTHVANKWKFATIHTFNYSNGAYPQGNLIMDSAGNLYGATLGGDNTYNGGVAFKLSPTKTGWSETVLHAFGAPGDGSEPSSLVLGASGQLFGSVPLSTNASYATQNGYVFELSLQANGTWRESVVYAFPNTNAAPFPNSNLIWNTSRTALMGTTGPSSDPAGTVYEVTP